MNRSDAKDAFALACAWDEVRDGIDEVLQLTCTHLAEFGLDQDEIIKILLGIKIGLAKHRHLQCGAFAGHDNNQTVH